MNKKKVLLLFGTRPELIKLAPLIYLLKNNSNFKTYVCFSGQHPDMVKPLLDFFDIKPDIYLDINRTSASLDVLTKELIDKLSTVFEFNEFDLTIIQGDTTSSFVGGLLSFYNKVPVAHVEAGLRSYNKYMPFPEEMNRLLISKLTDLHFAPTEKSRRNLEKEGIAENVWVTGNTVIDALFLTLEKIETSKNLKEKILNKYPVFRENKKIILITSHRRENWGKPLEEICDAIYDLAKNYTSCNFLIPVHRNPIVRTTLTSKLKGLRNVHLVEPLSYPEMVYALKNSYLVLTDSGGLQEEAPSLGKPVLILRETTERIEGIEEGVAFLVGTTKDKIIDMTKLLLEDEEFYNQVSQKKNPYGDGKASERIVKLIEDYLIKNKHG